ncbi:MAG: TolC family protein [Armatimonadetes bacterium]|nr:TolC family protein [Armatimonadota bacterium]
MIWPAAIGLVLTAQTPALTVDEAVNIGIQNAFTVKATKIGYEKLRQRLREAYGALYPQIGLTYKTQYADLPTQLSADLNSSSRLQRLGQASLTFPVDINGTLRLGIKAADAGLRAQSYAMLAAENDVARDIRKAFYRVLQAQELVDVSQKALDAANLSLKNAELELKVGTKAKVDVLNFATQAEQAKSDLITAQNNLDQAKQAFNSTLGRPIDTPFTLAPTTDVAVINLDESAFKKQADENRPEILGLVQTGIALHQVTKGQSLGLAPSMQVSANHNRTLFPSVSPNHLTVVTVGLTWPIFDGGITHARVAEAKQDEYLNLNTLNQTRLAVSLEVSQDATNLRNIASKLDVAKHQLDFAEETYRLAELRYNAGEAIRLEVTDALTNLTRARTNYVNTRYDYLSAVADLNRALGIAYVTPNQEKSK